MKRLFQSLSLILLLMVAYQPLIHAQSSAETSADLKIIGVAMHADWCGKCKQLGPKYSNVIPEFKDQLVLFTKFDMTNDFTLSQSEKLAGLLGLSELFREHKGRTGYVVLLDAKTHKILKTLKHNQSEEELRQEIASVL